MKQIWLVPILAGWFFALQYEVPDTNGLLMTSVVGRFESKKACESYLMVFKEQNKMVGGLKTKPCFEMSDA